MGGTKGICPCNTGTMVISDPKKTRAAIDATSVIMNTVLLLFIANILNDM